MKRLIAALVMLPAVAMAQYPGLSAPPGSDAWKHAMRACLLGQGEVPLSAALTRCHAMEEVQRGEVSPQAQSLGCQWFNYGSPDLEYQTLQSRGCFH